MSTYKCYDKNNPRTHTSAIEASSEALALLQASTILNIPQENILLVEEMMLTCPKCSYRWKSAGRRKIHATCPQCIKQILIAEARK